MKSKIIILIPAYNEQETISKVVMNAKKYANILVVDDGSIDKTAELAEKSGAFLLKNESNYGYEKSINLGLAKSRLMGYTHAITMDADDQHDPETIPLFINHINNGIDLVLGVRNKIQRPAEKFFSFISEKLWNIKDPLCGMKAYNLSLLDYYGPFDSKKNAGTELAVRLVKNDILFKEVVVPINLRKDTSRYGTGIRINITILMVLVNMLFI
jgi:glycosyltransferase involved in cell wall biosynthesis